MAQSLKGRSLLSLKGYSPDEIRLLLDTSREYKRLKYAGIPHRIHEGKNIALLFEKTSTRTRCAFTVAANDLGVAPEYLGKDDIQLGKKETVEQLAKYAGVPVWNGLTDKFHPTQILADFLTIEEHVGALRGKKLVFVGDGRNNMANSLMIGSAKMGLDFRILAPRELFPDQNLTDEAYRIADENHAKITITDNFEEALRGADVIYTDVWVSMGEEDKFEERINQLRHFQVNTNMLRLTGNPEVKFMHCLPAFHDTLTSVGADIKQKYGLDSMEVTDDVFRSRASIVFDQAENRMHTIKAVIALTL